MNLVTMVSIRGFSLELDKFSKLKTYSAQKGSTIGFQRLIKLKNKVLVVLRVYYAVVFIYILTILRWIANFFNCFGKQIVSGDNLDLKKSSYVEAYMEHSLSECFTRSTNHKSTQ